MPGDRQKNFAFALYYAGLLLLVAFLPLSKFVMSVSQFMIVGGWLLDGDIKNKFKRFFHNKIALLVSSLYLLHLAGLIHTSDFQYAFKDLRIKLPLLILPLLLSTGPKISAPRFEKILIALIAGVTVSTLISFFIYMGWIDRPVGNIRDISIFISHIRLALLCCLSVFVLFYLMMTKYREGRKLLAFMVLPVIAWLIYFLFLLESLTGILILMSGAMILPAWLLYRYAGKITRIAIVLVMIAIPLTAWIYIKNVNDSFRVKENTSEPLPLYTASGNPFLHDLDNKELENGYHVWNNVCERELEQQWSRRSNLDYWGKDARNQDLRFTLIRFITSKGLLKDSAGIWNLDEKEIHAVESGIANVYYQDRSSINARIHQVIWEIRNRRQGGDVSGHSVAQRFEYWKAAVEIIQEHPVAGVGTGDVPAAFLNQYEKSGSPLTQKWRLRSHNQYLSIGVAFGIVGILWFLLTLLLPVYKPFVKKDFLYVGFVLIAVISMVTEDTLETQAGVTFFALFNSLLLFINPQNHSSGVISDIPRSYAD